MWLLWLMAGFAAGYLTHAVAQAVAQRRAYQSQRNLGLCFSSLETRPQTAADLDRKMLRQHGLSHACPAGGFTEP